jgi:hypothetical protein
MENTKTMETIKNKQSKLFNGIRVDKIEKVMDKYISYCESRIQSMEDEFNCLLIDLILKETNLTEDDIDENYEELIQFMGEYNWGSRYGLMNDEVNIIKTINNLNK